MPSVARLLRTELIRPRSYWVAKSVGAATAALAACACFGHAWLPALVSAAVAAGLALDAADSASQTYIVRGARRRARSGGWVPCGYPLAGIDVVEVSRVRRAADRATPPVGPAAAGLGMMARRNYDAVFEDASAGILYCPTL
jgi:hypothetical protein